jgi:hypothetical protein
VTVVAITGVAVMAFTTILVAFSLSSPVPQDWPDRRAKPDDRPGACEPQSVDEHGQRCAKALVRLFEQGKEIFRFDTFGDEDYWGGMLQLHKAVEGAALGGVGPGVSPKTALTVAGLKVDVDALPGNLQARLKQGKVDLDNPANTLALLELNAVVGVKGFFDTRGSLSSLGITSAISQTTSAGVNALPRREKAWVMPCAKPRFRVSTQYCIARVAVGSVAPTPNPIRMRAAKSEEKSHATLVNTVAPAQTSPLKNSVRRGPKRSAVTPPMIWNNRYG